MGFFHFHQHAVFDMQSLNTIVQKDASIVSRRIADEMILVPIQQKGGEAVVHPHPVGLTQANP